MDIYQIEKIRTVVRLIQPKISPFGNISFRKGKRFQITKSGAVLNEIQSKDFVAPDPKNHPSSETKLHAFIYEQRPEIQWVIHLHDPVVLKTGEVLHLPITQEEKPFGTQALVDEVGKILGKHLYILMKNHGIIALGSSLDETLDLIIKVHNACKDD